MSETSKNNRGARHIRQEHAISSGQRPSHLVPAARRGRKKRSRNRRIALACGIVLLALAAICVSLVQLAGQMPELSALFAGKSSGVSASSVASEPAAPTPEPAPYTETVRFSATGDDLIHSAIYQQAARNAADGAAYDFSSCYANMADFYAGYDVNWINQETLISNEIAPSTYPTFCTPGECAQALYNVGFRVFSLSNNHSYDKGAEGIASTRRFWAGMPADVLTTGLWAGDADYERIPVQEVNGIRIAYLSYTDWTNGIPTPSGAEANVIYTSETDVIQRQIALARQQADFVVVGVHWGVEDSHTTTDAQRTLAQNLADWGADAVIGTHPHVVQDAQWLTASDGRQAFVAYSLGNFISTQKKTDNLVGAVLTFTIEKTVQPDGTSAVQLIEPKLHPTVTHYAPGTQDITTYLYRDYTPELAAAHGVRGKDSRFTYDTITQIIQQNISSDFLDIT
ncbi:MAG: CapA family protein [Faecalibacterium sp.]|jgi:poly-gamma-glutamate synthesis protein (capsule biosynthesis protein)|nr:CapA family protein [Faecalibacterium sp.]